MPDEKKDIKVTFPPKLHGGVYANNMLVAHTKEEFIMDFLMVAPPEGAVTARVIVSPGHMKRILAAVVDNVKRYESQHGPIEAAEGPEGDIGIIH
ncbi:MAG: DUF3467 domain-containing protein [Candidatus Aminicenantaceae bacterium]